MVPRPHPRNRLGRLHFDLGLILGVPMILVGVHYLVPNAIVLLEEAVHPATNPLVAVASAWVHLDEAHLYGNVFGYLSAAYLAYVLCFLTGKERWFYVTVPVLLTVHEAVVSYLGHQLIAVMYAGADPLIVGFSSVVAGFVGFMFIVVVDALHRTYEWRVVGLIVASILLMQGALVSRVSTAPEVLGWGLVVAAVLAFLGFVRYRSQRMGLFISRQSNQVVIIGEPLEVLLVAGLFSVYTVGLFPSIHPVGTAGTSVVTHFVGLVFGALVGVNAGILTGSFGMFERASGRVLALRRSGILFLSSVGTGAFVGTLFSIYAIGFVQGPYEYPITQLSLYALFVSIVTASSIPLLFESYRWLSRE